MKNRRKNKGYKVCPKCCKCKSILSGFHKSSQSKYGCHSYCKECVTDYHRENSEQMVSNTLQWQANNPNKTRVAITRWQKRNPEKVREYIRNAQHKRRARKVNLPDDFTLEDWEYALNYFKGCCAVCERQMDDMFGDYFPSQDHWIPLSYKGKNNPGHVAHNIVPLCHGVDGCNNKKWAKLPNDWLIESYGKSKAKEIIERIDTFFKTVRTYIA